MDSLDQLTVELPRRKGKPRAYRCAGTGCLTTWRPRTAARVYAHTKNCLLLTPRRRQHAARHSAKTAPSALVAEDQKHQPQPGSLLPASSITSTSTAAPSSPVQAAPTRETFFGTKGKKALHNALDLAVVRLVCSSHLAPNILDTEEWKTMLTLGTPSYSPASRTKFMDVHLHSEQARISQLQYDILKEEVNISISFDGGSVRSGESVYTVHATTADGRVLLLEGVECTNVSHTGEWIANMVMRVSHCISYCLG